MTQEGISCNKWNNWTLPLPRPQRTDVPAYSRLCVLMQSQDLKPGGSGWNSILPLSTTSPIPPTSTDKSVPVSVRTWRPAPSTDFRSTYGLLEVVISADWSCACWHYSLAAATLHLHLNHNHLHTTPRQRSKRLIRTFYRTADLQPLDRNSKASIVQIGGCSAFAAPEQCTRKLSGMRLETKSST